LISQVLSRKSNKAVVKVAACGVNFIDVYLREDRYKAPPPFVAGQEGAGVVNAIDSDVKRVGPRGSLYSRGCPAQAWLGRDLWQKMWTTHVDL
jgi:NADPH:quinone reductase-like Zn-dependent oxidoreductase